MLRTALEVKPELVLPVVREAIDYLPVLQQPALLMLNPADADSCATAIGEELDKGGWRVVPKIRPSARGGCRIDTATNQIDATLRVALAAPDRTRWARTMEWLGP